MKRKFLYLAIASILFSSILTFGLNLFVKKGNFTRTTRDTTSEEYKEFTLEKPTDKKPNELSAEDNLFIALGVFKDQKAYQFTGDGMADAKSNTGASLEQKIRETGSWKDGNFYIEGLSKSNKFNINIINQRFENEEDDIFLLRKGDWDGIAPTGTYNNEEEPTAFTKELYDKTYGIRRKSPSPYIINKHTLLNASMEKEESFYRIKAELDLEISPELYKRTLAAQGGAKSYPNFYKVSFEILIDSDWVIHSSYTYVEYEIEKLGGANVKSWITHNYTYEDKDVNNLDYFKKYFDLVPKDVIDEELTARDILMESFVPYLESGFNFDIKKDGEDFIKLTLNIKPEIDVKGIIIPFGIELACNKEKISILKDNKEYSLSLDVIKEIFKGISNKEEVVEEETEESTKSIFDDLVGKLLNGFTLETQEDKYILTLKVLDIFSDSENQMLIDFLEKAALELKIEVAKVNKEILGMSLTKAGDRLFKELTISLVKDEYKLVNKPAEKEDLTFLIDLIKDLISKDFTLTNVKLSDALSINKLSLSRKLKSLFGDFSYTSEELGKLNIKLLVEEKDIYIKLNDNIIKFKIDEVYSFIKDFLNNNNIEIPYLDMIYNVINVLGSNEKTLEKVKALLPLITQNKNLNIGNLIKKLDISKIVNNIKDLRLKLTFDDFNNTIEKEKAIDLLLNKETIAKYLNYLYPVVKNNELKDNFEITAKINTNEKEINLNLLLNVIYENNNITLKGIVNFNGITINVLLDENFLYVNLRNNTLKISLDKIISLSGIENININLKDLVNNIKLEENLTILLTGLMLQIKDSGLDLVYQNENLKASINLKRVEDFQFNLDTLNVIEIINEDIDNLLELINNILIKDAITLTNFKVNNELVINKFSISKSSKALFADITYKTKNLRDLNFNVLVEEKDVYLTFKQNTIKVSLDDFYAFIKDFATTNNLEIPYLDVVYNVINILGKEDKLLNKVKEVFKVLPVNENLDVAEIISNLDLGNILNIIKSLNITFNDFAHNINKEKAINLLANKELLAKYINYIYPVIVNNALNDNFEIKATVVVNGKELNLNLLANVLYENNKITLKGVVSFNEFKVQLLLEDGFVYANLGNNTLKVSLEKIISLAGLNKIEINTLDLINEIILKENLTIMLNGLVLELTEAGVNLDYQNEKVKASLNIKRTNEFEFSLDKASAFEITNDDIDYLIDLINNIIEKDSITLTNFKVNNELVINKFSISKSSKSLFADITYKTEKLGDLNFNVLVENKDIYVKFNNNIIKVKIDELFEFVKDFSINHNLEIPYLDMAYDIINILGSQDDLLNKVKEILKVLPSNNGLDLNSVVNKLNIEEILNTIKSLNVSYDNFEHNIEKSKAINPLFNKIALTKALDFLYPVIKNKVVDDNFEVNATLNIGARTFNLHILANVLLENNNLTVKGIVELDGIIIKILLEQETLYVNLFNKTLSIPFTKLKSVLGMEGLNIDVKEIINNITLQENLKILFKDLILQLTDEGINLNYISEKLDVTLRANRTNAFEFIIDTTNSMAIVDSDIDNIISLANKFKETLTTKYLQLNNINAKTEHLDLNASVRVDLNNKVMYVEGHFKYDNVQFSFKGFYENKKIHLTLFDKLNLVVEVSDIQRIYELLESFGIILEDIIPLEKLQDLINGGSDIKEIVESLMGLLTEESIGKLRNLITKALEFTTYNFDSFTFERAASYEGVNNILNFVTNLKYAITDFALNKILSDFYVLEGSVFKNNSKIVSFNANLMQKVVNSIQTFALNLNVYDFEREQEHRGVLQIDDTVYLNYNDLKVKLLKQNFISLIGTILNNLGMGGDMVNELLNLDLNNANGVFEMKFNSREINLDTLFKEITISKKGITAIINKEFISNEPNVQDVYLRLNFKDKKIEELTVRNILIDDALLNISLVSSVDNGLRLLTDTEKTSYIPLTNIENLVTAFFNTANLRKYRLLGGADENGFDIVVAGSVINIKNVDIKIEIDEFDNIKLHAKYYVSSLMAGTITKDYHNRMEIFMFNNQILIKRTYKKVLFNIAKDYYETITNEQFQAKDLAGKIATIFCIHKITEGTIRKSIPADETVPGKPKKLPPLDALLKNYVSTDPNTFNMELDLAKILDSSQFKSFNLNIKLKDDLLDRVTLTGKISVINIKDVTLVLSRDPWQEIVYPEDFVIA